MAKELDPNDPTPYYYDAIRKQTENNPVGALEDLNKSIELNDNRAVYRSSLQLDQDEAARSASLANIYNDLSFDQLALITGWETVQTDPVNFSGHRLLSGAYATRERHETAQQSELLMAKMLQPLNSIPLLPHLNNTTIPILASSGPSNSSFSEYSQLFTRNTTNVTADTVIGTHNTLGNNLILSGINKNFSYSIGQYHYESNGFRPNNHQKVDLLDVFAQVEIGDNSSIQIERNDSRTHHGDLSMRFYENSFFDNDQRNEDLESTRLGYKLDINKDQYFLLSLIDSDRKNDQRTYRSAVSGAATTVVDVTATTKSDNHSYDLQYVVLDRNSKHFFGASYYKQDDTTNTTGSAVVFIGGFPVSTTPISSTNIADIHHRKLYYYNNYQPLKELLFTFGLSYDNYNREVFTSTSDKEQDQINPKLGIVWKPSKNTTLRLAAMRAMKGPLYGAVTMETTQVAGFNQYFNDGDNGFDTKRVGLGVEHQFNKEFLFGAEFTARRLDSPETPNAPIIPEEKEEEVHHIYLYWLPSNHFTLSAKYTYDNYKTDLYETSEPSTLLTKTAPITATINYGAFKSILTATYVSQSLGIPITPNLPAANTDKDEFTLFDIGLEYILQKRMGTFGIYINNLFDQEFNYYDNNFRTDTNRVSRFTPDQTILFKANLFF